MKNFRPKVPGFLIGIKIVIVNMLKTLSPLHSKPNVNYPFEKVFLFQMDNLHSVLNGKEIEF